MFLDLNVSNNLGINVDKNCSVPFYNRDSNMLILPINYDISLLANFIKRYSFSKLRILSTNLIKSDVLFSIRDNKYINFITLGSNADPYVLTRDVFDILNASDNLYSINTSDVVGEYSSREREILPFFNEIKAGIYSINNMVYDNNFTFSNALSEEEIKYLVKYLKTNVTIYFNYNDYNNIISVIKSLKGRGNLFNIYEFEGIHDHLIALESLLDDKEKIYIVQSMSLDKYIFINNILESMVKDIKSANLSPYEKYLAVYEIVTHFKQYLENNINKSSSRALEYILFNDYIVCYGFVLLFVSLLDIVGIKAYNTPVNYFKEKEEVTILDEARLSKEEIKAKKGNVAFHVRVIVRLIDPKYGIDGIFIADPTWDNDLIHHYFNHSLMTFYETRLEEKEYYKTEASIFDINNSEEFLEILNNVDGALDYFIKVIKIIDIKFYEYLLDNYDLNGKDSNLLFEIYNYIINYTKRRVDKDIKYKALEVLFRYIYIGLDEDKFGELFAKIKEENEERNKEIFKEGRRK